MNKILTLYHGTRNVYAKNIIENGIDICNSREDIDFGKGFYLAMDKGVSKRWGKRLAMQNFETSYSVLTYSLDTSCLNYRWYNDTSMEWFDEVFRWRIESQQSDLDFIAGAIADGDMANIIRDYRNNLISKDDLHKEWAKGPYTFQLALKSDRAIKTIQFIERTVYRIESFK